MEIKMKKGDKVEFICFGERVIGEIHRSNKKDKTFDVLAEDIIYPNAKAYKKGGITPYTTANKRATKDLAPWYILN